MAWPDDKGPAPLLQTLALLRGAVLVGVRADRTSLHLRFLLPDLAQRLASGTRHVNLVLTDGAALWLQPFEDPAGRIDSPADLAALRLQLLALQLPAGAEPGLQVLATAAAAPVHGGLLRLQARVFAWQDETGAPLDDVQLAQAAQDGVADRLRQQSLGGLRKTFDALLKQDVAALLAAHGFAAQRQSQSQSHVRADAEVAQVLQFEIGRFSTALSLSFSVLVQLYLGRFEPGQPLRLATLQRQAAPVWSANAGSLWGEANHSFTLDSAAEADNLSQALQRDLATRVLPVLQRLRDAAGLIHFLDQRDQAAGDAASAFALGSALARAGRAEDSRPFFQRALGTDATANEALRKYALSLGVVL